MHRAVHLDRLYLVAVLEEPVNIIIGLLTLLGIHTDVSKLTYSVLGSLDQRKPQSKDDQEREEQLRADRHREHILRLYVSDLTRERDRDSRLARPPARVLRSPARAAQLRQPVLDDIDTLG